MKSKVEGSSSPRNGGSETTTRRRAGHTSSSHSRSRSRSNTDKRANGRQQSPSDKDTDDKVDHDAMSIYIGNVDYGATEEDLRDAFIDCGEIVRVTIIRNMRTGHSKGVAFVEFAKKKSVEEALTYDGKEVRG